MTFQEYDILIEDLVKNIQEGIAGGLKVTKVYGIPRGGYYPAIKVANALGAEICVNTCDLTEETLIVDDLCDSGKTLAKYEQYMTAVVILKEGTDFKPDFWGATAPAQEWIQIPDEKGAGIEENIRRMLQCIGEDPDREGLLGTPDRIARMFKEIFRGYDPRQKPKITTFQNGTDGITYDNMVIDEGNFYSCCEHHMMPFFGHYWFAYIPNPKGRILGISKIGRVIDYCSAKLQVQERLVHDIVEMLEKALGDDHPPLGIALVMKGEHLCKTMRGAKKQGIMTSSFLTGMFKTSPEVRAEFMQFVNH